MITLYPTTYIKILYSKNVLLSLKDAKYISESKRKTEQR